MLTGWNLNRIGTDKYYVRITTDGKEGIAKSVDDELIKKDFKYKLSGFNEENTEKTLEFKANKNLLKDAFLCIYYSTEKNVKSWEEVKENGLPAKVKEKLGET